MSKIVHLIYHRVPNDRISDMSEVVGVVTTGWQDADAIVDQLNARDPSGFGWQRDYWKKEVDVITKDDVPRRTP